MSQSLQPGQECLDDLLIALQPEEQGDIHIDAIGGELLDGRNTLWRGRHLDHDVVAGEGPPEASCLSDGALGIARQVR